MTRPVLVLLFTVSAAALADEKPAGKPVFEVTLSQNATLATKVGKWTEPVKYTDPDQLKMWASETARAEIAKQVDLKSHDLLVFCWQGSGQDNLTVAVTEGKPESVTFARTEGRTDDLRTHVKLFAVRKNVKWSAK